MSIDVVDPGYPRKIALGWPGAFDGRIDTAISLRRHSSRPRSDPAIRFFNDTEYVRYDVLADGADPG